MPCSPILWEVSTEETSKSKTVKNWRKMPQKRVAEQLGNAPRILSTQGSIVKCHEKCTLFVVGPFGPMCALQPRGVNNIL